MQSADFSPTRLRRATASTASRQRSHSMARNSRSAIPAISRPTAPSAAMTSYSQPFPNRASSCFLQAESGCKLPLVVSAETAVEIENELLAFDRIDLDRLDLDAELLEPRDRFFDFR